MSRGFLWLRTFYQLSLVMSPPVLKDQHDTVDLVTGTFEPSMNKSGEVFTLEKVKPTLKRKKKSVREMEEERAEELFQMKKRVMQHEMDCRAAEYELKLKEHELKMKLLNAKLRQVSNTGNK